MCGIFGYARETPEVGAPGPDLAAMARAVHHRGTEGRGWDDAGWAGIGATRLRLLDPRRESDPPAFSEDRRITAVLNGEIYNHDELRGLLRRAGHRPADRSDSSLLPHLWEEFGEGLFERLRGAFAIALLDRREGVLVLARDRLGEKPLVVTGGPRGLGTNGLLFASEPRALAASGLCRPVVDDEDLGGFLRLGYVPSPRTGLVDIHRLDPGSLLIWRRAGAGAKTCRYWRPPLVAMGEAGGAAAGGSRAEQMNLVARDIEAAVREQVIADRPTGLVLSGGIDSGLVAAFAAAAPRPPKVAFTVKVGGPFDESALAEASARHLGLVHRIVALPSPEPAEALQVLERLGEPLADSSALAVDRLCAVARREVVAVLSGDGGDELFGGYRRFAALRLAAWAQSAGVARLAAGRDRHLPGQVLDRGRSLSRFVRALGADLDDLPAYWRSLFWDGDAPALLGRSTLGPCPREARATIEALAPDRPVDPLERARLEEMCGPLADDLLVKMDRLSMAHGLEVRCPLLDRRVVERALAIPMRDSVGWLGTKRMLRALATRHLPRPVARARKRGFGVPLGGWLRGSLRELLDDLTCALRRRGGPFERRFVESLIAEHDSGLVDHAQRLWALLVWHAWCDRVASWRADARGPES